MTTRRSFFALAAAGLAALLAGPTGGAGAAEPIKVGEINSYTRLPAFTLPYRNGWQLAVAEINAAGGVLGRPLEVISRDDGGKPGDAVKIAEELVSKEGVALLAGTFFSHIGLAVTDFAKQRKVFFIAAEPLSDAVTWQKGNRYTFRLRPNTYMQANMLAEEAAKLPAKRWATIAPNYKYGQDAVASFKEILKAKRPDVEFVAEQWPALFKIEAGAEVQALANAKPEAIYNVTFGSDLAKFVREGKLRGLFEGREVVSLLTPSRTRRRKAGSSPAIPGTRSTRRRTTPSSPPTRPSSTTIRGSARWSATTPSKRSPRLSPRPARPTPRRWSRPPRGSRSTRRPGPSPSGRRTTNRPWAPMSGARRSGTARA